MDLWVKLEYFDFRFIFSMKSKNLLSNKKNGVEQKQRLCLSLWASIRRRYPWMYGVVVFLCAVQLIFTLVRIEAPPFYVYSMYSLPMEEKDTLSVYLLKVDGAYFNEPEFWNHHRRILVQYTAGFYDACKEEGMAPDRISALQHMERLGLSVSWVDRMYASQEDIELYPQALHAYMERLLGREIQQLELQRCEVVYDGQGFPHTLSTTSLCIR